jgi:phage recombination protein Bet
MNGSGNSLAVRNGTVPAQQDAALALVPGQTMWTRDQHAALVAMGIPAKASSAELGVFLHTCQRLRLDPFLKQIYLIYRKAKENGVWVEKPTTQIGIDGFRVTRDRICAERGLSVEYEDTTWYDADGHPHEVWLWNYPPAACKFVVKVDGRRFPATLNFNEYCQRKQDGELNSMWQTKSSHQIEKCAEAEGLRKAFPNDLSGVILEDAAPLSDPDAPDRLPSDRQRVTAADARARSTQTVTATVVTPEPSPAGTETHPRSVPSAVPSADVSPPAGEAPATASQVKAIWACLRQDYGFTAKEEETARAAVAMIAGSALVRLESLNGLTEAEASRVLDQLHEWRDQAKQTGERPRDILAADIASRDADPRDQDGEPGE